MSTNSQNSTPEIQGEIEDYLEVVLEEKDHSQITPQEENPITRPALAYKTWGPQNPHETKFKIPVSLNAYTQSEYNPQQVRIMRNADTHRFYEPRTRVPLWIPPNSLIRTPPTFNNRMDNQHANAFYAMHSAYACPAYERCSYRRHITKLIIRLIQKYQVNLADIISDLSKINNYPK